MHIRCTREGAASLPPVPPRPKAKPLAGFAEPGANGRRANFLGTRAAAANGHAYGPFTLAPPRVSVAHPERAFAPGVGLLILQLFRNCRPKTKPLTALLQSGVEWVMCKAFWFELTVSGHGAQLAGQEVVRRPRTADRYFAVLQLLGGGGVAVLVFFHAL